MPHLNGPVDWAPTDQAPVDGTIVYGFFDAHTEDTGLIAHVRPVRVTAARMWSRPRTKARLSTEVIYGR